VADGAGMWRDSSMAHSADTWWEPWRIVTLR